MNGTHCKICRSPLFTSIPPRKICVNRWWTDEHVIIPHPHTRKRNWKPKNGSIRWAKYSRKCRIGSCARCSYESNTFVGRIIMDTPACLDSLRVFVTCVLCAEHWACVCVFVAEHESTCIISDLNEQIVLKTVKPFHGTAAVLCQAGSGRHREQRRWRRRTFSIITFK